MSSITFGWFILFFTNSGTIYMHELNTGAIFMVPTDISICIYVGEGEYSYNYAPIGWCTLPEDPNWELVYENNK